MCGHASLECESRRLIIPNLSSSLILHIGGDPTLAAPPFSDAHILAQDGAKEGRLAAARVEGGGLGGGVICSRRLETRTAAERPSPWHPKACGQFGCILLCAYGHAYWHVCCTCHELALPAFWAIGVRLRRRQLGVTDEFILPASRALGVRLRWSWLGSRPCGSAQALRQGRSTCHRYRGAAHALLRRPPGHP
jgi:hypothetical protein